MVKLPTGQFSSDARVDEWTDSIVNSFIEGYSPMKKDVYAFRKCPKDRCK